MLIQISGVFSVINNLEEKLNLTLQSSKKSLLETKLKLLWVTDNHISAFARNFASLSGRSSSFGKPNFFRFSWIFLLRDLRGERVYLCFWFSRIPDWSICVAFPVGLMTSKACANPTNSMFVVDATFLVSAGLTTSISEWCWLHVSIQKGWTGAPQLTSV